MSPLTLLDGRVMLWRGDCLDVLVGYEADAFDSCVTDPPYHLASIVKRFGNANAAPAKGNEAYIRASTGFMGKRWDGGDIAFRPETWAAVLRVLKPGAHMVAFGAPKNAHRLAIAIEDAGFEIRDMLMWIFGSGFPKSKNAGDGWGTALKPAYEPIILARKPLNGTVAANILAHGTGAINVDGCRVSADGPSPTVHRRESARRNGWDATAGGVKASETDAIGRMQRRGNPETFLTERPSEVLGRWPANVIHDGSEEVLAAFPDAPGAIRGVGPEFGSKVAVNAYGDYGPRQEMNPRGDEGSAARFFYSAKADASDRLGSRHPTVKPVDLMRWLCRLITPKGGTILDPFAGTGTTGEAAFYEGFRAILIEREEEYQADIRRRLRLMMAGPDERIRESAKARQADKPQDAGPLFGGLA